MSDILEWHFSPETMSFFLRKRDGSITEISTVGMSNMEIKLEFDNGLGELNEFLDGYKQ